MFKYLSTIWDCRYFWLSLVKIDLRSRYRGSMLGLGWALVRPILMTIILCTAFHTVFDISPRYYAPFILSGLACWNFIVTVIHQGSQCFFQGESYLRQYPTPVAIYPLRTTLGALVHLLLALGVVLLLAATLWGIDSWPALLCLLPSVALLFVFGWSVAVLLGFANVFFRDTQQLADIGLQAFFYMTPVLYPPKALEKFPLLQSLVAYNPFAAFLTILREPVLEGQVPSLSAFGVALATTACAATLASIALVRWQRRLVFYL